MHAHSGFNSTINQLGTAFIIGIGIILFMDLIIVVTSVLSMINPSAFVLYSITDTLSNLSSFLNIGAGIIFIIWMYRCYNNLTPLKAYPQKYQSGWVIAGWLIPLVNFVIPYQIMREIWYGSDPIIEEDDSKNYQTPSTALLNIWWILWIGTWLFSFGMAWLLAFSALIIVSIIEIGCGLCIISIVKRINKNQHQRMVIIQKKDTEMGESYTEEPVMNNFIKEPSPSSPQPYPINQPSDAPSNIPGSNNSESSDESSVQARSGRRSRSSQDG